MRILAIDPDTRATGLACIAFIEGAGRWAIETASTIHATDYVDMAGAISQMSLIAAGIVGYTHLVVEGQEIYAQRGKTRNPASILQVATVAGAALAKFSDPEVEVDNPLPKVWKGQVPKYISQSRAFDFLGIEYELTKGKLPYCIPRFVSGAPLPRKGDWKHASDAIALAVWKAKELDNRAILRALKDSTS